MSLSREGHTRLLPPSNPDKLGRLRKYAQACAASSNMCKLTLFHIYNLPLEQHFQSITERLEDSNSTTHFIMS